MCLPESHMGLSIAKMETWQQPIGQANSRNDKRDLYLVQYHKQKTALLREGPGGPLLDGFSIKWDHQRDPALVTEATES